MIKFFLCLLPALVVLQPLSAADVTLKIKLDPIGKFEALTSNVQGVIAKKNSTFISDKLWIDVSDLHTGIKLRDWLFYRHLHKDEYPEISLQNIIAKNGQGTGDLHANGVIKNLRFTYKNLASNKIEARFRLKPSDFNLSGSTFIFIKVVDDVEVITVIDKI